MSQVPYMDRIAAIKLLGKDVEDDIFKQTDYKNYAYIVRKVYKGSTLKQALHIEGPETEEIFDVAEGDLVCPKCKSRKIIRKEMQTRSADESATVFCECFDCKKRFKF